MQGSIITSDRKLNAIIPLCVRSIMESSHDNYVDCPFYEHILYSGDGRLEALVSYVLVMDDKLTRKALTLSRHPSRSMQIIPSFSLWWIGMVYDYACWRRDRELIISLMPGVRTVLGYFISRLQKDGLITGENGLWHFVDWAEEWKDTANWTPPGAEWINATTNWMFVYILGLAAEL